MADEKKTYLINFESNLKKYIEELIKAKDAMAAAKKAVDDLKTGTFKSKEQIEKVNAAYRQTKKDVGDATRMVDLISKAMKSEEGSRKQLGEVLKFQQYELGNVTQAYIKNAQGIDILNPKYTEQRNQLASTQKAIIQYDQAIGDGRSNVGNYSAAIEGAIGKFQAMPGPIGAAASSVKGLSATFKMLLANPIVAIIAAIATGFMALVKVFKSTAEGGGKIKDIMASLGAAMNELRVRAVAFIDVFKNLFKGDFKAAGESIRKVTDDFSKSLIEAGNNAANLSKQQRQLTKELAMHVSEEANEINKIQEYLYLSKDKSKTDAERLNYLKEALRLGKEQAEREVYYSKRQWDIDVATAANKAKIDKQVLADWVQMDAEAQMEMLKNREDLQAAYNLLGGSEALKALEESYSKQIQASTDFYAHNKRAISQSSALEEELRKEKEDKFKAYLERQKKAQEDNFKLMFIQAKDDADKTREALKLQLDAQLKDKKLSDTEKLILQEEYRLAVDEINKKEVEDNVKKLQQEISDQKEYWENQAAAEKEWDDYFKEKELINAENKLAIRELQNENEFQIQRDALQMQQDAEIENAKKTGADVNLIYEKYAAARRQIDKAEARTKLELMSGFAGGLAELLGKTTALGKTAAVAQATIDTYLAAQKAYAAMAGIPPAPVWGIVAAATAVMAGIANVKKILEVKSGLPGDSGGGSVPTAISSSAPAMRTFASSAGSTVLTQQNLSQTQLNALPNQNLLTAEDIAAAVAKIPAPIVTVEDINAKTKEVQKVSVRATI